MADLAGDHTLITMKWPPNKPEAQQELRFMDFFYGELHGLADKDGQTHNSAPFVQIRAFLPYPQVLGAKAEPQPEKKWLTVQQQLKTIVQQA